MANGEQWTGVPVPVPAVAAPVAGQGLPAVPVLSRAVMEQRWQPGDHVAARRLLVAPSGAVIAAGSKGMVIAVDVGGGCSVRFDCGLTATDLRCLDIAPIHRSMRC